MAEIHWCGRILYISIAIAFCMALGEALYFILAPCQSKVDMIFMLDTSQSVSENDLKNMTNFCETIIKHKNVEENGQSIIAQFSHIPEFILENDSRYIADTDVISSNLENFKQLGYYTNTWGALRFIDNLMVNAEFKRNDTTVKNVLFFVTDGNSEVPNQYQLMEANHDGNKTCREQRITDKKGNSVCPRIAQPIELITETARSIEGKNVEIYAVGVAAANETELLAIAGDETRTFKVDNFEKLDGVAGALVEQLCTIHWWLLSIPAAVMVLGFLIQILLSQLEVRKHKAEEDECAQALKEGKGTQLRPQTV